MKLVQPGTEQAADNGQIKQLNIFHLLRFIWAFAKIVVTKGQPAAF